VLPSHIFTRVTDWPGYLAHPPTCTGVPPEKKINRENLKFGLKLSVWASIASGLVGISSPKFSRRRPVNFGPQTKNAWAQILTHPKCLYTSYNLTQFHMPRGSRVQFSGSFRRWRCWESNLNWQSTWYCGAGRPHVWLCHALLVYIFISPIRQHSYVWVWLYFRCGSNIICAVFCVFADNYLRFHTARIFAFCVFANRPWAEREPLRGA